LFLLTAPRDPHPGPPEPTIATFPAGTEVAPAQVTAAGRCTGTDACRGGV